MQLFLIAFQQPIPFGISALVVIVMIVVMVLMVVMVMIVVVVVEEMRVVLQHAAEVEGTAVEHLFQTDAGALGLVDPGGRIDGAHRRFDVAQLLRRHQVGLVEHDHVGEGDLVLGLPGVLQPQRQTLPWDAPLT